ncbi:unnamed protein product [Symbiodinium sp. KB8]|nr:unnamed protein product [Symbiodinium sp. KB8]
MGHASLDVRRTAVEALRQFSKSEAARPWVVAALCESCAHESLSVRRTALQALPCVARLSDEPVIANLQECLVDEAWQLRLTALQSLEELLSPAAEADSREAELEGFWHSMVRCLHTATEPHACVRLGAVHVLGRLQRLSKRRATEAVAELRAAADTDPDTDVQDAAQQELA